MISLAFFSFIFSQFLAAPIDYSGGEETLNNADEWSAKYAVGSSCDGDGYIELTIDITAATSEADVVLGFGTEDTYFAIVNGYDGGLCLPCTGSTQSGTLFVTPPRGQPLRSAASTTTAQYGATNDALGARVALVNGEDETANWDKIVGEGSNIGKNTSPIKLAIVTDAEEGTTTLTVTKNGVTSATMQFTSTFEAGKDLFLYLGIDNANAEAFTLSGITKQIQCYPSGPIEYNGEDDVFLYKNHEWSVKYPVTDSCTGDGEIILEIDIIATSAEADLILGFGTEGKYFALFNSYDGGMCLPCSGNIQSGTLFVTPPRGQGLRRADITTTAQYGETTNTLGARAALVNNEDQTVNWDKIVGESSNIGKNTSPIILKIMEDADEELTTLELTKNGITTETITFTSTFGCNGSPLFLFLGIDNANEETFKLTEIRKDTKCIPTAMCCTNPGGQATAKEQKQMDRKCKKQTKQNRCEQNECEWTQCTSSVVADEYGEYWVDNKYNGIYEIANNNVWMYGLAIIVFIFIIFAILFKNNRFSEYKNVDDINSMTPLLPNNKV